MRRRKRRTAPHNNNLALNQVGCLKIDRIVYLVFVVADARRLSCRSGFPAFLEKLTGPIVYRNLPSLRGECGKGTRFMGKI